MLTGIEKENFESRVKSLGKNAEWCLEMLPYSLLLYRYYHLHFRLK